MPCPFENMPPSWYISATTEIMSEFGVWGHLYTLLDTFHSGFYQHNTHEAQIKLVLSFI
jgi:hypothetical protein